MTDRISFKIHLLAYHKRPFLRIKFVTKIFTCLMGMFPYLDGWAREQYYQNKQSL